MNLSKLVILTFLLITGGCSSMSATEKEFGPLKTVDQVDLPRFMGKWYVIANIPTFVEKGATNAIETYTWNEAENRIDIDFRFNQDTPQGPVKKYPQKGFIYNQSSKAEWRVQPIWPLKFAYLVIDLAPDYSYTIIGVPNRSYVWIMARTPSMDEKLYLELVEKIKAKGYDIGKLQRILQEN